MLSACEPNSLVPGILDFGGEGMYARVQSSKTPVVDESLVRRRVREWVGLKCFRLRTLFFSRFMSGVNACSFWFKQKFFSLAQQQLN